MSPVCWLAFVLAVLPYNMDGSRIHNANSTYGSSPGVEFHETVPGAGARPTSPSVADKGDSINNNLTSVGSDKDKYNDDHCPGGMRSGTWVIVLIVLAGLCIMIVVMLECYMLYQVIKKSEERQWRIMWLGQVLVFGLFLSYLVLFAFVPKPSRATCGILRFGIGVSYAMCFSVLLVKLLDLLQSKTIGYLKGIFQLLMFIFAWGIQIAIDILWMILRPPALNADCNCSEGYLAHITTLPYVMFLIVLCTGIAIAAHGIPTNHREGIFIGLCSGFSIVVWIVWVLLGALHHREWQDPCLAFGLFITATLILLIMFLPKERQKSFLGIPGVYKEDKVDNFDYAPSVVQPSVRAPSVMANSVAYTPPRSVRNGGLPEIGGPLFIDGVYTESVPPRPYQILYEGDNNALHLRHPQNYMGTGSVRSGPAGYVTRRPESLYATTRVLKKTNDLTGRPSSKHAVSESNFNPFVNTTSTFNQPLNYKEPTSTITKRSSLEDLGSL